MTLVRTALVIGGGIAGPVTAMALHKAGIDAVVYEAHDGPADGIGGMLGLAPNGLAALAVIGVEQQVLAAGEPVPSMIMRSWTGRKLAEFGDPAGPPALHTVWRTDLFDVLHREATSRGIKFEFGKRLISLDDNGDSVTAHFTDGTSATADILIGADGIRSTVRNLIDPAAPHPRYTGLIAFGGRPKPGTDVGLPSTCGSLHMVYGKQAVFAYGVFDNGGAGWFANVPSKQPVPRQEAEQIGALEWLRRLASVFAEDRSHALRLLEATDPNELVIVGSLEDLPSVPTWHRGRVVLAGDSAHATSPSSGQGGSIAIESAVQLARCLRDLPVPAAFPAYERLRRERVERIIAAGANINKKKAPGPVARVLRDLFLPTMLKLIVKPGKMAWQLDYRIDWDEPVA
jgi:2-polyprenyl-6-methoxyphenol hydroxylase-like FAD-dependent oxidoreductase